MTINFVAMQPSFIEWEGYPLIQIFTFGCNWRCRYCFQRDAVLEQKSSMSEEDIIERLKHFNLKFDLDHIEIIGGEPTIWGKELVVFAKKVHDIGYHIQLATNGSEPRILRDLLPYVDRIALDYKTDLDSYSDLIQRPFNKKDYINSIKITKKFKDYVLRTVYIRDYHTDDRIQKMINLLNRLNIPYDKWELHPSLYSNTNLDPNFVFEDSSEIETKQIREKMKKYFKEEQCPKK